MLPEMGVEVAVELEMADDDEAGEGGLPQATCAAYSQTCLGEFQVLLV